MQGPWAKTMAEKYGEMSVPSDRSTTPPSTGPLMTAAGSLASSATPLGSS
jgi:hypothetical protein